jgi:hypothetical protein
LGLTKAVSALGHKSENSITPTKLQSTQSAFPSEEFTLLTSKLKEILKIESEPTAKLQLTLTL